MAKLVCLDPGHSWAEDTGGDPGAENGDYKESVAALSIALQAGKILNSSGFDTIFTRRGGSPNLSLKQRCSISNVNGANAFVSIHLNAAENKSANGIEVLRYSKVGRITRDLAEVVLNKLLAVTQFRNRGVKERNNLYVLKHTNAPAILCEVGFISNDVECKHLFNPDVQHYIASAIAEGVTEVLTGEKR